MQAVKDGGRYGSTQATVLCIKALVKYAQVFGGIKGSGKFVLYLNDVKVGTSSFNEDAGQINNVNFNDDLNAYYLANQAKVDAGPIKFKIAIEDYTYNTKGNGFRLSYLLETNIVNKLPKSVQNAPIKFELKYDKEISQLTSVGSVQTQTVIIENKSGKAQGMVVSVVSIPSCMTVEQS